MRISVVIPVYNGKKYLLAAVNSVIKQTLQPIELIIVDDGSTDGFEHEIKDVKTDFPLRILKKENGGQSSARNHGIKEAKGDFIALLDQDDIWYSQHLEKLAEPFHNNPDLGWVYSNVDNIDEHDCVYATGILDFCGFQHPQTHLDEMIRRDMHILPAATLVRKEAFIDVGMFDERLSGYEDDDIFMRLFIRGWKRKYISEPLSQWRIHPNNSGTGTGFKSRGIYAQKIIDKFTSSSFLTEFSAAEIIGVRFYNVTYSYYLGAVYSKNFIRSYELWLDLKKYYSLCPKSFQKSFKVRMLLMKMPRLFKFVKMINRRIF